MYPPKQYIVKIDCPLSGIIEEVAFHEEEHSGKYYVGFDGCDHQYSKCTECETCHEEAYKLLLKSVN